MYYVQRQMCREMNTFFYVMQQIDTTYIFQTASQTRMDACRLVMLLVVHLVNRHASLLRSPVSRPPSNALRAHISTRVNTGMFRPVVVSAPAHRYQRSASLRAGREASCSPQDDPVPRAVRKAAVCEALCAGHHATFFDAHPHLDCVLCVALFLRRKTCSE